MTVRGFCAMRKAHEFVEECVGIVVEKSGQLGLGRSRKGPIALREDIGAGKGSQEPKTLDVLGQGRVVAVHADKLDVVPRTEPQALVRAPNLRQPACVVEAEVVESIIAPVDESDSRPIWIDVQLRNNIRHEFQDFRIAFDPDTARAIQNKEQVDFARTTYVIKRVGRL
jgi:hypothetical protein